MPLKSLDQSAQPFEVKVGLGFGSFGGMYRLGEPSMCPAHRFRRLLNVRLGEKDITSRPGLDAKWVSPDGNPVVGMIEQFKSTGGKLFWGPFVGGDWILPTSATLTTFLYGALLLDNDFPLVDDPAATGKYGLGFIPVKIPYPGTESAAESVQAATEWRTLGPTGHRPYLTGAVAVGPAGKVNVPTSLPYYASLGDLDDGTESHTHFHLYETVISDGGVNYYGIFPDEQQWGCCLDPPLMFQGKWIAPGSIIPVLHNPSVLAGTPVPSQNLINTGQQVFEVVLDAGLSEAPPNLAALVAGDPVLYSPENLDNYFAGSVTELFRVPGKAESRIPTRALGGLDGKSIRSLCVRSTRNDHPLTAAESTSQRLYMGTFGGAPLLPAAWKVAGQQLKYPIQTLTNGEVYSFDGTTVKLETTGLGPTVVVCTLPDGSILACGRTAAKLLDAQDETWKAVAYNPTYSALPRSYTPPAPTTVVSGFADADWRAKGFIWTDRAIFKGEAYFVGIDTALLALGAQLSTNPPIGAPLFGLVPPGGVDRYDASADSWVLYRFDRAAMQMVQVRTGDEIYVALQPTRFPTAPADPFTVGVVDGIQSGPCLAVWNERLYYSWRLGFLTGTETDANGIGQYDGSTFDDDAVFYHEVPVPVVPGNTIERVPLDMLGTSRGLFVTFSTNVDSIATLQVWDGGALSEVIHLGSTVVSHTFVGPGGALDGRMFLGPS